MEIGAPRIGSCSKEHQKIYKEWFDVADSDNDGRVTGNNTINFLSVSNLSRQELKQVWAIEDSKRQGYLGFKEFVIAMQQRRRRRQIKITLTIEIGLQRIISGYRRKGKVAPSLSRWRRSREKVAHILAINSEGVPVNESLRRVNEGGHDVVVEEQHVAANHL